MNDKLIIAGREFNSRLITGTGKYRTNEQMVDAFNRSGAEMITVAVRRVKASPTAANLRCWISLT